MKSIDGIKQKVIMFGIEKITIIFDGLSATIDIYNRKTKTSAIFDVDSFGVIRESSNYKVNTKGLYKALTEIDKNRKEVFAWLYCA